MLRETDLADQRLITAPQVTRVRGRSCVAWPAGGLPAAFDEAAATLLSCFVEAVSPRQIAEDLVAAIGLEPDEALQRVEDFATTLLRSGHLLPEGAAPMSASRFSYPPSASP